MKYPVNAVLSVETTENLSLDSRYLGLEGSTREDHIVEAPKAPPDVSPNFMGEASSLTVSNLSTEGFDSPLHLCLDTYAEA